MTRRSPYGAFNFTVSFGPGVALGGFSDLSGLVAMEELVFSCAGLLIE